MTAIPLNCVTQIRDAYRRMAIIGRYRPMAPSDGFGNITVPDDELDLEAEAAGYARQWWDDEDAAAFRIGCCDFESRIATVFAVEAARQMCGGMFGARTALRLLRMAVAEMERVTSDPGFIARERWMGEYE